MLKVSHIIVLSRTPGVVVIGNMVLYEYSAIALEGQYNAAREGRHHVLIGGFNLLPMISKIFSSEY